MANFLIPQRKITRIFSGGSRLLLRPLGGKHLWSIQKFGPQAAAGGSRRQQAAIGGGPEGKLTYIIITQVVEKRCCRILQSDPWQSFVCFPIKDRLSLLRPACYLTQATCRHLLFPACYLPPPAICRLLLAACYLPPATCRLQSGLLIAACRLNILAVSSFRRGLPIFLDFKQR